MISPHRTHLIFLLIILILAIFPPLSKASDPQSLTSKFTSVNWDNLAKSSKKKSDDSWKIRIEVERGLVMEGNAAVPVLIAALGDKNRHLRALAASVLGAIGNYEALPHLQKALESDPDPTVRLYAAESIGRIGQLEDIQSLELSLKDPNANVRDTAQQSIARINRGRRSNLQSEYAKIKGALASATLKQPAPDFFLMSPVGERYQLSFFRNKQPLLLIFTVGDWSERCSRMLSDLQGLYPNIRSRYAEVLVVNPQDLDITSKWHKDLGLHFPILSDPTGLVGAIYGVGKQIMVKDRWVNLPAAFIVDKVGILQFAYVGRSIDDRPSVVELVRELDKVR